MSEMTMTFAPVTAERWDDFEKLFGKNGACAGCWCMWWRITRAEFGREGNEGNKAAMRAIITAGRVPGLLAYVDGQPAGWVSVAPREEFASLERSRVLARVDEQPVWSIVCFFVGRGFRRQGLTRALIGAAVEHARAHGARIVEAYPVDRGEPPKAFSDFTGWASTFRKAGFQEVARRSEKRPVMRLYLE